MRAMLTDPRRQARAGLAGLRARRARRPLHARSGDGDRDGHRVAVGVRDVGVAEEGVLVTLDEAGVVFAGDELGMLEQLLVEREVRADAGDDVLRERAAHALDGALARRCP